MQNRSNLPLVFAPIPLDPAFPSFGYLHLAKDYYPVSFLHFHDAIEIGFCHEGEGTIFIGEKILTYRKSDVVFIGPNEVHFSQSAKDIRSLWSWVHCVPEQLLSPFFNDVGTLRIEMLCGPAFDNIVSNWAPEGTRTIVESIIDEMTAMGPNYQNRVRSLYYLFFSELHRAFKPSDTALKTPQKASEKNTLLQRIYPSLEHMAKSYQNKVTVSELAKQCFMSPVHFRRVFAKATGRSPLEYLINVRISMSLGSLRSTAKPIGLVAAENGFPSQSSFNRKFREFMGCSPLQWRKQGS